MTKANITHLNLALIFILFSLAFLSFCTRSSSSSTGDFDQVPKVPNFEFLSSLKSTIDVIRKVTPIVSNVGGFFGDFRLTTAINDCLDLLDYSADDLDMSASASQDVHGGKSNGTGNLGSDLRTWLSAALTNQETCIDGFEGTNGIVKTIVASTLGQITPLVKQLLTTVPPTTKSKPGSTQSYPSWVQHEDQKLLQLKDGSVSADAIVAQDGSGKFKTIMDAIEAAPDKSLSRFVIYVKKGVYKEYVEIKKKKWNLMMIGDGMGVTIISGSRNVVDGYTTFRSATFAVSGKGFIASGITFENTAGPVKHQAVALRADSDLSVFYRCAIIGYQDSLYTHTMRQFYRECRISGTVDFIFGDATAVFQNCQILARKGLPNQKNTITAHGRKDENEPTGFSFQFCNFTADSDLLPVVNSTETYLGRPWKPFSRTVIMQSYMSDVIKPRGWLEWNGGNVGLDTLYYGEFMNYGPGSRLSNRVKWPGYHAFNDSAQASNYTVSQFIKGNLWLPSTGVTFTAGLSG